MNYAEMFKIAEKNVVDEDWEVAQRLISELGYPFVDSRENRVFLQLKTICFILKMFEEGKKVILLDAAVGTGKSLINVTVSQNMQDAFITLPQKTLQAQYVKEFPELVTEIKGRNNYMCMKNMKPCSEGACRQVGKYKCCESDGCEYWRQKQDALDAKICVSNFSYFCLEGGRAFDSRELLVVDEGDDIAESSILSMCSVKLSYWTLRGLYDQVDWKKLGRYKKYVDPLGDKVYYDWLTKNSYEILEDVKELLTNEIGDLEDQKVYSMQELKTLENYRDLLGRMSRVEDDWIVQRDKQFVKGRHGTTKNGVYESIEFKPLSIASFAEGLLWNRSDKVIISSATILDRKSYVAETGLDCYDEDEIVYVKMGSMFPVERRLIYDLGKRVGKLTAKDMSSNIQKAVDAIIEIANEHRDERGLIHTTSFKNVDILYNMLNTSEIADRMVYHTNQIDRNELIDKMMNGKTPEDSIVVSPSMTRGADLKGNLCRFNVLLKVPFPNVMDARIKVRSRDFRWYSLCALKEVEQAYGRGMRSESDYCDTYLLDLGFARLLNGVVKCRVSTWFKDAIV